MIHHIENIESYNLHSDFDIEKHRLTFNHYLEIIIDETGKIMYAVPSHLEKMIHIACDKLKITRDELNDLCPKDYYFDFITWISKVSNCCAVWNDFCIGYQFNLDQLNTLQTLKREGLYFGMIPILKEDINK